MNVKLVQVKADEKDILYRLLQFALYDGRFYINNELNEYGIFEYKYFDDYFTDSTRDKYFIKFEEKLVGFVLINENNKFNQTGKTIAEFLIIPNFRRHHIGKKAAILSFEQYPRNWEVQPMENNPGAYNFWEKVISEYTNGNYEVKNDKNENVFIFNNKILNK